MNPVEYRVVYNQNHHIVEVKVCHDARSYMQLPQVE